MKTRIRKIDNGEYWIEILKPFESWTLIAIAFKFSLAQKIRKLLQ